MKPKSNQCIINNSLPYPLFFINKKVCQIKQMGTCVSQFKGRRSDSTEQFDSIPTDTPALKGITLPTLAFYVLLSDIKIKKCLQPSIYLRFKIEDVHSFDTPSRQMDRSFKAYWKICHIFEFYMTEYELRNKFLEIQAYSPKHQLIGSLKINMFVLWVGPYHLDFKMEIPKSPNCRISLNFKISQGIHLTLDNLATEMVPLEQKFMEDRFTYSIEAIIGQQLEVSACPYIVCVKDGTNQVKEEKSRIETYYVPSTKIIWKQEISQELPLPKFDKNIAFYEIYSSSLHLTFFRVLPGFQQKSQPRYEVECQCFISLAKLMTLDYMIRKDPMTNIVYYQRLVQLTEKTWIHGKEMGVVKISFKFILQSHLKQMQACVRTENGILTSSPVFNQTSEAKACQEIQALKALNEDVQRQFINLDQNAEIKNNFIMVKENILRIVNLLTKELALLQKSSKESILFYQYQNQGELFKAQRFLIDLAFKASAYIHEDNPDICEICWTILTAILKRGEFKLSHMGFSKQQKGDIEKKNIDSNLALKIQTALKYQELMNHLLKETLNLFEFKGEEAEQIFAESFSSYAYFRIPLFRQHILSVIYKENDPQIREWRGTQVNLYQDLSQHSKDKKHDDFYENLFDWENNFYKPLVGQEKFKLHNMQLQTILLSDKWKNRLGKRGGAFYTFLENLVKEIEYVSVVSKYIKWHHMPGYNRLLHAFLVEMKKNKIKNYTERFKRCCTKLLSNEKLLNIFVAILLNKTNINQPETVQITFEMIDGFLTSIRKNLRTISGTFDYKYFLEGIKIVLESQQAFSISQVLLLIYNHLYTFSNEFALQLIFFLLSKHFFKLFFSWSFNLRHIFHTLLYVRISKIGHEPSPFGSSYKSKEEGSYAANMKTSIQERYNSLINMVQKQIDSSVSIGCQSSFYDNCLYKKMKAQLTYKRKNKNRHGKEESIHISSINEIPLPDNRSVKSLTRNGQMINPYKMIYFKEEEMLMISPKDKQLCYAKQALAQYNALIEQIKKNTKLDPKFTPDIKVKKIIDEKELGPLITEQW